jgi:hypothetical protein
MEVLQVYSNAHDEALIYYLTHLIMVCCAILIGWIAASNVSRYSRAGLFEYLGIPERKLMNFLVRYLYKADKATGISSVTTAKNRTCLSAERS